MINRVVLSNKGRLVSKQKKYFPLFSSSCNPATVTSLKNGSNFGREKRKINFEIVLGYALLFWYELLL